MPQACMSFPDDGRVGHGVLGLRGFGRFNLVCCISGRCVPLVSHNWDFPSFAQLLVTKRRVPRFAE
jgi:hypothetical protein